MLSARQWAPLADRTLRVAWQTNSKFGASISDLFVIDVATVSLTRVKIAARMTGGYQSVADIRIDDTRPLLVTETSDEFRGPKGPLPWWESLGSLRPTAAVTSRVAAVGTWTVPTVGVMIRAHPDALDATRRVSTPEWFYSRMAEIRSTDSSTPFFLSTDNEQVSAEVHRRFDNVYELSQKSPHNSLGGVQDALSDLYLLAGTTYILGSHVSSFSGTAGLLAGHGGYETARTPAVQSWPDRRAVFTVPKL